MFFALCILVSSPTTIRQFYFNKQMPTYGSYEFREEGSGVGLNISMALVDADSLLIILVDMSKECISKCWFFIHLLSQDKRM